MPLYKYEARNLEDKVLKGKLDASDVDELRKILKQRGFFLTKYESERDFLSLDLSIFVKIPKQDLSIFCRQMYFSLSSGITVFKSIEIVKDQIENKRLRKILSDVYVELEKGRLLSDSFKRYKDLPNLFVYMIQVGEETGKMDEIMGNLADYYDNQYKQEKKIKNALIYPKFLLVFSILIVLSLVTFIVPLFTENLLSANKSLPFLTQVVVDLSNFVKTKWMYLILAVFILVMIKKIVLDKSKAYTLFKDKFIVKFKFIKNMTMPIYTARFARTFSILFSGGISVIKCVEITSDVLGNSYLSKKLLEGRELLSNGASISESLENGGAFPKMLVQSIKVGEESGSVDKILKKASEFYDSEANFAIEKLTSLIEPMMIIILALLVGFIVVALLMPMFSMYDAVQ